MADQIEIYWKNINQNWIYYTNPDNFSSIEVNESEDLDQLKKKIKKPKLFYKADRKLEKPQKGSLCYTAEGFGIIQDINSEQQIFTIKLKSNNSIKQYYKKELKFDLVLQVKVINGNSMTLESISVPLNCSIIELEKIINQTLNSETGGQFQTILYQGKELSKLTQFELQTLGINEKSKFLALNPQCIISLNQLIQKQNQILLFDILKVVFLQKLNQLIQIAQSDGWCYSNGSKDGITFQVSRDVRFAGIGMYTTREETDFDVKLVEGKTIEDNILTEKTFTLNKTEGKIMKCLFNKSIQIKADILYSIIQICQKSANGFYGQGAQKEVTGENGIVFTFQNCSDSSNGTYYSRGQIPEIYYYA